MTEHFDYALEKTLKHEGFYSNHPNDTGGETYRGISRKWHKDAGLWKQIDSIKASGRIPNESDDKTLMPYVRGIYKELYWEPIRAGQITHRDLAAYLFDCAVLHGVRTAGKYLQEALNSCGQNVSVDGKIGEETLYALRVVNKPELILNIMRSLRMYGMLLNVQDNPSQVVFLNGWLRRAMS